MSWEQIGYTVLGSAASTVSIAVPTPYDFYRVSAYIANDSNAKGTRVVLNGSASGYTEQTIQGASTSLSAARASSLGIVQVSAMAANQGAVMSALVAKPSSAAKAQAILQSSPQGTGVNLDLNGGEWDNTSDEVTSVALVASTGNFAAGTSFLLEGLSA